MINYNDLIRKNNGVKNDYLNVHSYMLERLLERILLSQYKKLAILTYVSDC